MVKYPFDPEILDAMPEELAEVFRELELTLLKEICERLNMSGQLNQVTVEDIKALRSHGISLKEIKKAISEATNTGEEKLEKLLDDVVERNQKYYTEVIELADITEPSRLVDESDIEAIRKQTKDEYRNITQSMGFLVDGGKTKLKPAKAYQWALDNAELQVQTGAISYQQAIESAVTQLAQSGLKTVSYESGHVDQVDVAVRRAVMTGTNQLCLQYANDAIEYLGTDLVQVSAHYGARNTGEGPANHESWQGGVYRWKEKSKKRNEEEPTQPESLSQQGELARQYEPIQKEYSTQPYTAEDVTNEYNSTARPNTGKIFQGSKYKKSHHSNEISMSEWLHKTFGGNITLLNEADKQGVKTADFSWNGKLWELKYVSSATSVDRQVRGAIKQIAGNSGGIIIECSNSSLPTKDIIGAITYRLSRSADMDSVDVLLVSNEKLISAQRYKKT